MSDQLGKYELVMALAEEDAARDDTRKSYWGSCWATERNVAPF
jgi:hypothetical protein